MSQTAPPKPEPTAAAREPFRWRRLTQYRLTTLLVVTTLIAGALGCWSLVARLHREEVKAQNLSAETDFIALGLIRMLESERKCKPLVFKVFLSCFVEKSVIDKTAAGDAYGMIQENPWHIKILYCRKDGTVLGPGGGFFETTPPSDNDYVLVKWKNGEQKVLLTKNESMDFYMYCFGE